jgi:CAP-Gly domain-containing linker protein 1
MQNVELLEEDRATLELKLAEAMVDLENAQRVAKNKSRENSPRVKKKTLNVTDDSRLMEAQEALLKEQMENEELKQQVEFLNSVIVDLQNKLEAAENLALGHLQGEEGHYEYEDQNSHESSVYNGQPPPRLFCDICDVFDQHDTDDCPLQAGEFDELAAHSQHHGERQVERPYCETCEAFGHQTYECPYDATY